MATFDVFVDGPATSSPDASKQLVDVMARRYGLPAKDLAARLAKGRFRVKSNIDEPTAKTYARDLASIGARVTIEPSAGTRRPTTRASQPSLPARAPVTTPPVARPQVGTTSDELELDELELAPPGGSIRPSAPRLSQPPDTILRVPPPLAPPRIPALDDPPAAELPRRDSRPSIEPRSPSIATDRTPRSMSATDLPRHVVENAERPASQGPPVRDSGSRLPVAIPSPFAREASAEAIDLGLPGPVSAVKDTTPQASTRNQTATPPAGVPFRSSALPTLEEAKGRPTPPSGLAAASSATGRGRPTPPTGLAAAGGAFEPKARPTPPTGLAAAGEAFESRARPTAPSGLAAAGAPEEASPRQTPPTGLAAALASDDMGALDGEALSLAPLDAADVSPPAITFATPARTITGDLGLQLPEPSPPRPRDLPVDLFSPPGAEGGELQLEIATEDLDPRKQAPAAPAPVPVPPPSQPVAAASPTPTPTPQRRTPPAIDVPGGVVVETPPAWHFSGGVALAFVIGLVVSQLYVAVRGDDLDDIDAEVETIQDQTFTAGAPVPYDQLDEFRAARLSAKQSRHDHTALLSFGVWLVTGGAVAAGWFLGWPRLRRR